MSNHEVAYRVINTISGRVIYDTFGPICSKCVEEALKKIQSGSRSECVSCPLDGKRMARHSSVTNDSGSVFSCALKSTLVSGEKTHSKMVEAKADIIEDLDHAVSTLKIRYQDGYRRLLHNIDGHIGHIVQEFQDLASEQAMVSKRTEQKKFLAEVTRSNPRAAAKALLKMFQSAVGVKTEVSIYRKLYLNAGWDENLERHRVHSLVMNTAYKFFEDFNDRSIVVDIAKTIEFVWIDYECVSIVMYHIFDNARKYALERSVIIVSFGRLNDSCIIRIEMTSAHLAKDERARVFQDGIQGENAKNLKMGGGGLGMGIISAIVERSNIGFKAEWGDDIVRAEGGVSYSINRMELTLPVYRGQIQSNEVVLKR